MCCSKFPVLFHLLQKAVHLFTTHHFAFYQASSSLSLKSHTAVGHFPSYCKLHSKLDATDLPAITNCLLDSRISTQARAALIGKLEHALLPLPCQDRAPSSLHPVSCADRRITQAEFSGIYTLERIAPKCILSFGFMLILSALVVYYTAMNVSNFYNYKGDE